MNTQKMDSQLWHSNTVKSQITHTHTHKYTHAQPQLFVWAWGSDNESINSLHSGWLSAVGLLTLSVHSYVAYWIIGREEESHCRSIQTPACVLPQTPQKYYQGFTRTETLALRLFLGDIYFKHLTEPCAQWTAQFTYTVNGWCTHANTIFHPIL